VLFGGGRNMDFNEEETTEFEFNETILDNLVEKLHTIILPQTSFEIDYAWTGIMAFGDTKFPNHQTGVGTCICGCSHGRNGRGDWE
jgi:gamma-glutamylputrescine oxidase